MYTQTNVNISNKQMRTLGFNPWQFLVYFNRQIVFINSQCPLVFVLYYWIALELQHMTFFRFSYGGMSTLHMFILAGYGVKD